MHSRFLRDRGREDLIPGWITALGVSWEGSKESITSNAIHSIHTTFSLNNPIGAVNSDWVRVRYFWRPLSWRVFPLPLSLSRSPVWTVLFSALLWAFFIKRQAWDSIQNQRHRDDHIFSRQRSEPGCTDACVLLFSGRQNTEWKRLVCDRFLITKSIGPIKTRSKYL